MSINPCQSFLGYWNGAYASNAAAHTGVKAALSSDEEGATYAESISSEQAGYAPRWHQKIAPWLTASWQSMCFDT